MGYLVLHGLKYTYSYIGVFAVLAANAGVATSFKFLCCLEYPRLSNYFLYFMNAEVVTSFILLCCLVSLSISSLYFMYADAVTSIIFLCCLVSSAFQFFALLYECCSFPVNLILLLFYRPCG